MAGAVSFYRKTCKLGKPAQRQRISIQDILPSHLVTSLTIIGHAKNRRTIMTCATGFTMFQLLRVRQVCPALRCECVRMTLETTEHAKVGIARS